MQSNQNETSPAQRAKNGRQGFTLVELLVVIAIIGVLAALGTAAALNAFGRGKQVAVTLELQQIGNSVQAFKNQFGAYPPNGMSSGSNIRNQLVFDTVRADFQRMFKKAFPRHQEPAELIGKLIGDASQPGTPDQGGTLAGGMTSAEALFFWLGGFSADPVYPISGVGGPSFTDLDGDQDGDLEGSDDRVENRNNSGDFVYEFDVSRLLPRNSSGAFDDSVGTGRFIEYDDPQNPGTPRRINFWLYAPRGSDLPMVYVDVSRRRPADYDADISGGAAAGIFALKRYREGFDTSQTPTIDDILFVEDGKFQILHPGLDDVWGDDFARMSMLQFQSDPAFLLRYPDGPFLGDIADTLSNFYGGELADESE